MELRKAALEAMVQPLTRQLDKASDQVRELEKTRVGAYTAVHEEPKVMADTSRSCARQPVFW
ncbi:hypothetical protein AB0B25_23860 [Nocardia sp. NPDC049190]|uniref:hypothetical protein n=1 Tax=Nocardia sp. NPDC049190 TaxID=3155650 RepID=UPI0033E0E146